MFRHYEQLKKLAREKRSLYNVDTTKFGLREVRKIYKAEGIKIDQYPTLPNKIKAIYMCEDGDFSVAIPPNLPIEPKLFALVHELKHHYCDQAVLEKGEIQCGDFNKNELIEIGAEVFAAEFIYPEAEFAKDIIDFGIKICSEGDVVRFKRSCKAKISYMFLCKRLVRLGLISKNQFKGVQFQKLEYKIYGLPFYLRRQPLRGWKRA